ncbi:hypothetical protein ED733_003980 [Metarhizium rileyi]|uniref:Uncharacterized protein n=1 Tax=Metarhizium rileyi (strain RCEF 4871) TaxID=1649241 RepID=A0A5C6GJP3_METRR|nr:hypothetical protein ED733_003980 [Metarhizium rileyi]
MVDEADGRYLVAVKELEDVHDGEYLRRDKQDVPKSGGRAEEERRLRCSVAHENSKQGVRGENDEEDFGSRSYMVIDEAPELSISEVLTDSRGKDTRGDGDNETGKRRNLGDELVDKLCEMRTMGARGENLARLGCKKKRHEGIENGKRTVLNFVIDLCDHVRMEDAEDPFYVPCGSHLFGRSA